MKIIRDKNEEKEFEEKNNYTDNVELKSKSKADEKAEPTASR